LYNDVLGVQTNLYGQLYSELIQNMSPISLSTTNSFLKKEISLEVMPPGGPYVLTDPVVTCKYLVDRPVLPRIVLEYGVDFTIDNGVIVWANPEAVSSYPFALQTTPGGTYIAIWLVDSLQDESWLYKYYGSLLDIPQKPSSTAFSNFLQGVLYLQINGPIVDVLNSGLQIAMGLPLALFDEVVIATRVVQGEYVVITDQTSYSVNAGLGLTVSVGSQFTVGQPIFPLAAQVVDYQTQDKWWLGKAIPPQLIPNPPEPPVAIEGNWVDEIMEGYLKTHTFMVEITTGIVDMAEFSSIINTIVPTYTYPLVFAVVARTDPITLTDALSIDMGQARCDKIYDFSLFTRTSSDFTRGCPKFQRFNIPARLYDRNFAGGALMGSFPQSQSQATEVYFPTASIGLGQPEISYSGAALGLRNTITPRFRSSYSALRSIPVYASNPYPGIIPLFLCKLWYLKENGVTPTGWKTTMPYGALPFPTEEMYLNWYTPAQAYTNTLNPTDVPTGSSLEIFNLLDDLYGVNLVLPEMDSIPAAFSSQLPFGYRTADFAGNLEYEGTIPMYRGAAPAFSNPAYFSRDRVSGKYDDSLNSSVPLTRGGISLASASS
jgi:hypothetical protein